MRRRLPGPDDSVIRSNDGATVETASGEPDPTGGDIANTVWFAWTPTGNGLASFTFDAPFLGSLAVYTGSALDSLAEAASNYDDNVLTVSFDVVAGTTYYIQVGAYFDTPGTFQLDWSLLVRPVNDHLADAIALAGVGGSIGGTTRNATIDGRLLEPTTVDVGGPSPRPGSNSVWYRWTPVATGDDVVSVEAIPDQISHQPLIQVYQGPSSGANYGDLTPVGAHNGLLDSVAVTAVLGSTYYIQVMADSLSDASPDFDFTLTWGALPRDISGSVRSADGSIAPGVLVRACLGASCSNTTSNSDGVYVFSGVAPGAYVVRALPSDPTLLAAQANADVTLSSAQGIDLRLTASGAELDAERPEHVPGRPAAPAARCTTSRRRTASCS